MLKGFRNFLMRGDVIVVAIAFMVALAFKVLIEAFTTNVINPLIASAEGKKTVGLGWQLVSGGGSSTFINIGLFISAVIYFIIFMAVLYFLLVLPYKAMMKRRGTVVFGDPAPTKTCPECLSSDLPAAANKCWHCASVQPASSGSASPSGSIRGRLD